MDSRESDSPAMPLNKADRVFIINGLRQLDCGYADELADRFEATKCRGCRGTGYMPYVGGDDTDDDCDRCGGSGFA